jgi:hypothetical protein
MGSRSAATELAQPLRERGGHGLMVALLALCPIRRKSFAALEIGHSFIQIGGSCSRAGDEGKPTGRAAHRLAIRVPDATPPPMRSQPTPIGTEPDRIAEFFTARSPSC